MQYPGGALISSAYQRRLVIYCTMMRHQDCNPQTYMICDTPGINWIYDLTKTFEMRTISNHNGHMKKNHRSKKSRTNFHNSYFNSNFSLSLCVCWSISSHAKRWIYLTKNPRAISRFEIQMTRRAFIWIIGFQSDSSSVCELQLLTWEWCLHSSY